MTQVPGRQVLVAAAIVGIAVIAGSLVLANSLNGLAGRLDEIGVAVADAKDALGKLPAGAPAQAARAGADPNRRYKVNIEGAPTVGPAKAAITLVEFSDFQ